MALRWRTRRRLALLLLVVGLPLYIVFALVLVSAFERPPFLIELGVYIVLGIAWALPFRWLFLGINRPEPEDERD